jgi:hypothetical protein
MTITFRKHDEQYGNMRIQICGDEKKMIFSMSSFTKAKAMKKN